MSEFKFSCPTCSQHLECEDSMGGSTIQCPSCQNEITVPVLPTVSIALSKDEPPANKPRQFPAPVPRSGSAEEYGGIGRLGYCGILIGTGILEFYFSPGLFVGLCILAAVIATTFYRLKNTGLNGWWSLLLVVPIANLVIGFRCLVFPEGYSDTKTLDPAGKAMIAGLLVLFVLAMLQLIRLL